MALVDLFNQAMSANGVTANIADPDENSREAALCRQWYTFVRDLVMGAAPWPSLKAYARLAQSREREGETWYSTDPSPEFRFAFSPPSAMVRPRYLQSLMRFEWAGGLIHTNDETPILTYLKKVEDVSLWDQDLLVAVTYGLAAQLAIPGTGKSQRFQENMQVAQMRIEDVSAAAANAQDMNFEKIPDWFQVRGYANSPVDPYYYPLGSLNLAGT